MAPIGVSVAVLAHEGGWDEVLLVAGPIAVIVVLLAVVRRRLDARAGGGDAPEGGPAGGAH